MTSGTVISRRLLASGLAAVVATAGTAVSVAGADPLDPDLMATLELRNGFIDYLLEPGTLHFFDDENQPLAVQVADGCSINDHYWVFGAGLSGIPIQLSVRDFNTGNEARPLLPPYEPGKAIGTVFDPEALPICGSNVQVGGLPRIDATVTLTSTQAPAQDDSGTISLLSDGSSSAYRRLVQGGEPYRIISRGAPVAVIDESDNYDRLYLFTEGRTPRTVEGVVFTGDEGMLPARTKLDKALAKITRARVRRAYETAKSRKVPNGIVEDLGLRDVKRVHHADLDFETLGSDAYLTIAGWIKPGKNPPEPPGLVEERFTVELVAPDGMRTPVPLVSPLVGSPADGERWLYRSSDALVQIADACDLSGSFWTWAGARTEDPLELVITDTTTGEPVTLELWTAGEEVSRLSDTTALAGCP
jgi:hypothetical protein